MAMGDAGDALAEKMLDWMLRGGRSVGRWLLSSGIRPALRSRGARKRAEQAADDARERIDADLCAEAAAYELTDGLDKDGNLVLWAPDRDTAKRIRDAAGAEGMEARIGKKECAGIMRVTVMANADSRGREAGDAWEPLDLDNPVIDEMSETYTFPHARSTACAWAAIDALKAEVADRYTQVDFDPLAADRNVTLTFVTKVVENGRTVVDDPDGELLMSALDRAGVASEAWPGADEDTLSVTFDARQTPLVHETIHAMCREVPFMSVSRFPGYGKARYEGMEKLAAHLRAEGAAEQIEMKVPGEFSPEEVARALSAQGIPAMVAPASPDGPATVVIDEASAIAHQQEVAEFVERAELGLGPDPLASEPPAPVAAKFPDGASMRPGVPAPETGERRAAVTQRIELAEAADERFAVRARARPDEDERHARKMSAAVNRDRARSIAPERTAPDIRGRAN